jgi:hypothetical protein
METNGVPPRDLRTTDEWQRVEQVYAEIQRRDGSAEYQAWRWQRLTYALLGLVLLQIGWNLYLWLDHRRVQAFVQTVQVDERGKLIQIGVPDTLLAYEPPDGVWMDMLGEWVRRVRWREEDARVHARAQWAWVYRHTCGSARRLLQAIEEKEHPFVPAKKLVSVDLKSMTKTPAPLSYNVLWTETATEKTLPVVKKSEWAGTFTVGRMQPPTLTDVMENRLGLCVTAFEMTPQPGG